MTSWRDSTSAHAQDDLDGLVNAALPFAQQMLDQHGEFFPYAVALETSGTERFIAGDPGDGERPPSASVLETLVDGLVAARDELRATALVSDVRLSSSDAVRLELEHREGNAISVFIPYKIGRFRRKVEYGSLSADVGSHHVWHPQPT